MGKGKINVLHAPTSIGGNPQGLARSERENGLNSVSMSLWMSKYKYQADIILCKGNRWFGNYLKRLIFTFHMLSKYDVFHYNFGSSVLTVHYTKFNFYLEWLNKKYDYWSTVLFDLWDVRLAYFLKKVIVVTYQGGDIRQGEYCRKHYSISTVSEMPDGYYSPRADRIRKYRMLQFNKYADLIYALNPDLLNVLPDRARFLPYASVDLRVWKAEKIRSHIDIPHVIHAPSNRLIKGSRYIIEAVNRLKKDGVEFRFSLVENLSQSEARKIYETADLLVDQLFVGWYGALAVELMALSKPVICYIRDDDMCHIPHDMYQDMPIIQATPYTVYDVLKEWLVERKHELISKGKQSRAYVEKWHDPVKIARQLKIEYQTILSQHEDRSCM